MLRPRLAALFLSSCRYLKLGHDHLCEPLDAKQRALGFETVALSDQPNAAKARGCLFYLDFLLLFFKYYFIYFCLSVFGNGFWSPLGRKVGEEMP